jgi:hypothetical protein
VNRSLVAAGLLTVAAAGAVGMVAREWGAPGRAPTTEEVCAAAEEVLDALGESVGDQLVLRARAASLADVLIDRSGDDQDGAGLVAARGIVSVLDDTDATVSDLADAVEPVVRKCP